MLLVVTAALLLGAAPAQDTLTITRLRYDGGGDWYGNPSSLPNLLAAGGAARGVSGQEVWGYLSGNGLLSAIAGGHMAAHTVQQLLKVTP